MKKCLIYFLVIMALLSSCKKDDSSVFNQSADDRLNATLAKYQTQLSGAQYGWKGVVFPAGGGAFGFYMKFNDSNRVKMLSDFDSTTAVTLRESSYRLKALQQPSLIFDTYSYIQLPADPNEDVVVSSNVNGGEVGIGLQSDFEFYFDSTTVDTIKLVGRFNGSKAILTRATSQDVTAYNSGQLAVGIPLFKRFLTYFKRISIGSQLFDMRVSTIGRNLVFTYLDAGGNAQSVTTDYYFIPGGLTLITPLKIGNLTINGFNNMQWNAGSQTITMTVNNTPATISPIVVPLKVDADAPIRWYNYAVNNGNSFWQSRNGFHVNGVDDGYGIKSLTSGNLRYVALIYYPQYNPGEDLFGPVFVDATGVQSIEYGYAFNSPRITADGRATFSILGTYGTVPTTGSFANTRAKLLETRGFYFVQTSASTYDMVSATDGRSWISWRY